jgi:hypothetical protein
VCQTSLFAHYTNITLSFFFSPSLTFGCVNNSLNATTMLQTTRQLIELVSAATASAAASAAGSCRGSGAETANKGSRSQRD